MQAEDSYWKGLKANMHSMEDNYIFNLRRDPLEDIDPYTTWRARVQMWMFLMIYFIGEWSYHYTTSPHKLKVHRSYHPIFLFMLSVYLPYRY